MDSENERVEEPDIVVDKRSGFLAPLLIWFSPIQKKTTKLAGEILLVLVGVLQLFKGK